MSIYHCDICEQLTDADIKGINTNPLDETECICDSCFGEFDEIFYEEFYEEE